MPTHCPISKLRFNIIFFSDVPVPSIKLSEYLGGYSRKVSCINLVSSELIIAIS